MKLTTQDKTFGKWVSEHIAIIHRVVNGFAQGEDRHDLLQEILLSIWKSIPSFRGNAQASTFIYRVSHNAAMTWQRGERRYRHRKESAESSLIPMDVTPVDEPQTELLSRMYAAIRSLRALDRSLILLSLDGLSYQSMAEIHGLTPSNVGARLTRTRKRLLKKLKDSAHDQ